MAKETKQISPFRTPENVVIIFNFIAIYGLRFCRDYAEENLNNIDPKIWPFLAAQMGRQFGMNRLWKHSIFIPLPVTENRHKMGWKSKMISRYFRHNQARITWRLIWTNWPRRWRENLYRRRDVERRDIGDIETSRRSLSGPRDRISRRMSNKYARDGLDILGWRKAVKATTRKWVAQISSTIHITCIYHDSLKLLAIYVHSR